jgi:hypothetical protein
MDPREHLVLEGLYEQSFTIKMSDVEAETLWQLHQLRGQTFDAACDALVSAHGYDKSALSDEQKADVVAEVEDLTEQWDEAEVAGRYRHDVTTLTACLKRYHELGEAIMDIRDEIVTRSRHAADDE